MINRNFVVISQQDVKTDPLNTTLHHYVGKKHCGTMKFANSDVDSRAMLLKLVEDYRILGDKIYDYHEPEGPQAA